jgi:phosphoglycolate phosphatase
VRRAVLLDLDGTLTDPREGIVASLRYALERLGIPPPPEAELARQIGPPLRDALRALLGESDAASLERAVRLYRERFAERGLFENRVHPGVPRLLCALSARGGRACVVTSKPSAFARRILRHFGLETELAAVYGSGMDGALARKPELVAHALACESLAPDDAVMVGDRRHDVEGARACGVASIGVTWGYGSRAELEAAGATWICERIDALEARLCAWLAAGS